MSRDKDKVTRLMEESFLAGAYDQAIRQDRRLEPGFGRLREKHRGNAAELAEQIRTSDRPGA